MYRDNCGPTLGRLVQAFLVFTLPVLLSNCLSAQDTLALSSAANGSATSNLALTSSEPTAVIEWTLTYPSAKVVSVSASSVAAVRAAGKTVSCGGASGTYTCVASAMIAGIISNGPVAVVNSAMEAELTTAAIRIGNRAESSPTVNAVTMTQAAPTGGATVTKTNPPLTAPASATLAAARSRGYTNTSITRAVPVLVHSRQPPMTSLCSRHAELTSWQRYPLSNQPT
jgi:hypothetical protein